MESSADKPVKPSLGQLRRADLLRQHQRQRRRWWIAPAIGIALVLGFVFFRWLSSLPVAWETFRSAEGGFCVGFPAAPLVTHTPAAGAEGIVVHRFSYGTAWEDEFYSLQYMDVPAAQAAAPEALFDSLGATWVEQVEKVAREPSIGPARVLATAPYDFGGFPGRQMKVDLRSGLGILLARWILVKDRVYGLFTGVRSHHAGENDARFLASFQFLKK